MNKFLNFVQGFFKGGQSSTRLAFLFATFMMFGTWTYTIIENKPNPITRDMVYAYAIVVGGKSVGKYIENKAKSDLTTDETKKSS